jgi:hypothetical protein
VPLEVTPTGVHHSPDTECEDDTLIIMRATVAVCSSVSFNCYLVRRVPQWASLLHSLATGVSIGAICFYGVSFSHFPCMGSWVFQVKLCGIQIHGGASAAGFLMAIPIAVECRYVAAVVRLPRGSGQHICVNFHVIEIYHAQFSPIQRSSAELACLPLHTGFTTLPSPSNQTVTRTLKESKPDEFRAFRIGLGFFRRTSAVWEIGTPQDRTSRIPASSSIPLQASNSRCCRAGFRGGGRVPGLPPDTKFFLSEAKTYRRMTKRQREVMEVNNRTTDDLFLLIKI